MKELDWEFNKFGVEREMEYDEANPERTLYTAQWEELDPVDSTITATIINDVYDNPKGLWSVLVSDPYNGVFHTKDNLSLDKAVEYFKRISGIKNPKIVK